MINLRIYANGDEFSIFEREFLNMHFKWRTRMIAACDMVVITLEGGSVGGQLVYVTSAAPRECNSSNGYARRP